MKHPNSHSRYSRLSLFSYGEIGSHLLVPILDLCKPGDLGYLNREQINPQKPLSSVFLSRTCHWNPLESHYHNPFERDTKSVVIYNTDGSLSESFTYDEEFGRLLSSTKRIPNKSFTNSYTYDWFGRPWTRTYPSGFEITYSYTENGDLEKIYGDGQTIWECDDVNVLGQITDYSQGSYSTTVDYDAYGMLEEVTTGSVFNMKYGFTDAGNLEYREDVLTNQKEEFAYDDLNRLTGIDYYLNSSHTTAGDLDLIYDNGGNITSKSDLSTDINYGETGHGYAGPHALTSIEDPVPAYKPPPQLINYTCFNKVSTIQDTVGQDTILTLAFTYGLNNQRVKTVLSRNTTVERIKYFDGDYEEDSTSTGTKKYHYINSPTGLIGIFVKEGSADTLYHVLSDHLGSLNGVINAETDSVTYYSYSAWGIPRDPDDWTSEYTGELFAGRGFTGHEHLMGFSLINMNGRVYDPVVGRFLSPDPFVQAPGYANSFNRYSYCINNPLIYSDPDGELFIIDDWIVGFVKGLFDKDKSESAWQSANRHAGNSAKIWGGLFTFDKSNPNNYIINLGSRFIWQMPQTLIGFYAAHFTNMIGQVNSVETWGGSTVIQTNSKGYWGITLGNYITGSSYINANPNNSLFQHEYGHYIQSKTMGWAFLNRVGIPSLLSNQASGKSHKFHPVEQDANYRAFLYFNKNVYGFYDTNPHDGKGWDFGRNPIDPNQTGRTNIIWDYYNSSHYNLIEGKILSPKWYDFLFSRLAGVPGIMISGLFNTYYYNSNY